METERNKFGTSAQPKGGKDSTKTILTAAGVVSVGLGATVVATEWNNEEPIGPQPTVTTQEENATETTTSQTPQLAQPTQLDSPAQEIQPVDGGQTISSNIEQNQGAQVNPNKDDEPSISVDDVDPDLIAQEITAIEVDPNDNDVADVLTIDNIGTIYLQDGSEVVAAEVHTVDNGQYMMVDIDDDMIFDTIFDLAGNPITHVQGNLTLSDVIDMFDETGDELALSTEQIEQELAGTDTPVEDVIDTSELAMTPTVSEDELFWDYEEEACELANSDELAQAETGEEETIGESDA